MIASMNGITDGNIGLVAIAQVYVGFATSNPALYRLMSGPDLAASDGTHPGGDGVARQTVLAVRAVWSSSRLDRAPQ
jgi:hypothetical protein